MSLASASRSAKQRIPKKLFAELQKALPRSDGGALENLVQPFIPLAARSAAYVRGETMLVQSNPSKPESIRRLLDPYLGPSVLVNYVVERGVPAMRAHTANLLVTSALRDTSSDPIKAFRAAAFAGWAVLQPSSLGEVEETIEAIDSWLRSQVDERA